LSDAVSGKDGRQTTKEKHDIPGWKIAGRYCMSPNVEWMLMYEYFAVDDHTVRTGSSEFVRKDIDKHRICAILKYTW